MSLSLQQLHEKDVIQAKTGENLGRIDDLVLDEATAQVESAVLHGRRYLFGLLGQDEDLVIPWKNLKSIGTDVVMVEVDVPPGAPKRRRFIFR